MNGRALPPRQAQVLGVVAVVFALVMSACSTDPTVVVTEIVTPPAASAAGPVVTVPPTGQAGVGSGAAGSTAAAAAVRVVASPKFGSVDVAPAEPVTVSVFNATIADLTAVSGTDETLLAGIVAADGRSWKLTERMEYGTAYTVTGTAVAADGSRVPIDGTLSTVDPAETMRASFQLVEDGNYGVAVPIILTFAGQVQDKAAVQKVLTVTTDKGEIPGSWGWLQDEDIQGTGVPQSRVHFRTAQYWPGITQVTVTAALYGVALGNNAWGREDLTLNFAIGRDAHRADPALPGHPALVSD